MQIQPLWFNTMYLRNPRNVTGVITQILVIVLPVTSYQPKTTPDKQWMWLEGPFWSWWYASFWGFSGVKIWKSAILPTLKVGSWWSRMDMNGVKVNCCKHEKKLGLYMIKQAKNGENHSFLETYVRRQFRDICVGFCFITYAP